MIDIENIAIDNLNTAFTGTAEVSSVFVESPESFPWVYARVISNSVVSRVLDDTFTERAAKVTMRIEYFSDKASGAREEVKAMMQIGDTCMREMKFTRTGSGLIPNYDRTITRGYADYSAIVGEPRTVGDDTVFQMYRS